MDVEKENLFIPNPLRRNIANNEMNVANKMNVEMRYGTPPESIATIPKSLGRHIANKKMNVEIRYRTPSASNATIPKTLKRHIVS